LAKSSLLRSHLFILCIGTQETSDIILSTIDSELISREIITADFFCLRVMSVNMLSAKEVLPIAGLAAKMISSPGLNHVSMSSIPGYQELTFHLLNSSG
jgi:hypothetical protein